MPDPSAQDPCAQADQLARFRAETRDWLLANCPAEMREPVRSDADICWGGRKAQFSSPAQQRWMEAMATRGWTVPNWPQVYGGGGLGAEETKILREEMSALGCRHPLSSFGVSMLGPALLKYGTEAQKLEHLPPIARGKIRWCQGYSEPNAGSDLASLTTRAEDRDDHFLVNGQKIWTSYADKADWIFCLVRTDPTRKQGGISFLLFDMESPGVTVRPIRLISGYSPFCETFFDDVRVPKGHLVGEINTGWEIAKFLLGHEREMISGMGLRGGEASLGRMAMQWIGATADGRLDEPVLRARIALYEMRAAAFSAMSERFIDLLRAGRAHPAQSSMIKYYGTELNKQRLELAMAARGEAALGSDSNPSAAGVQAHDWLRSKGNSIEGGTSEIQLNIIAKRILDLPGE